jgi:predicted RNA binding protein YcfA (HicA-like mRNA interferase family)
VKLPRDISGRDFAKALERIGYSVTRQTGSHMRLTTLVLGEHHITIPNHSILRVGTLSAIVSEVCGHHKLSREKLIETLFR